MALTRHLAVAGELLAALAFGLAPLLATAQAMQGSSRAGGQGAPIAGPGTGPGVGAGSAASPGLPGLSDRSGPARVPPAAPPADAPVPAFPPGSGTGIGPQATDDSLNNPLNRNPARRANVMPDVAPVPDPRNSSERPTGPAAAGPDGRDTVITPDPSRYTLPEQPGAIR